MQMVRVTIREVVIDPSSGEPTAVTKTPIVPSHKIADYQRIYGTDYKGAVAVDEEGNEIKAEFSTKKPSAKEMAFNAMKERAKALKIKGYHLMSEDTLLKAIQDAAKKKSN